MWSAGLEATVGTFAGRATRGIDLKGKALSARLSHASRVLGGSSPIASSLQKKILGNQLIGIGVGLSAGSAANGLNKTMDKKE